MNKKLLTLSVAVLVCLSAAAYSVRAQTEPTPTPPVVQGAHHHHPAIRAAIGALERAKAEMQAATHDYGGHRVDAIAACDTAIAQLKLALQFASGNTPSSPTQ
jgi:hypothetical protein